MKIHSVAGYPLPMRPASSPSPQGHPPSLGSTFEKDVARVVLQLRAALTGVLSALGKPIRGGTDLQRELGLPGTLSWQLHGVINASDPITAASQIPGRQASKRALAAAAAKGVQPELIERAARAFDEFEACVERHTGSRAAFSSMLSGIADADSSGADLKARRDSYRSNSHIYGVQVMSRVHTFIYHRDPKTRQFSALFIQGLLGLRVMREFDMLFVGRNRSESSYSPHREPEIRPRPVLEPLQDPNGAGSIPVLSEFSSSPLPKFSIVGGTTAAPGIYISGPPVGRTGEISFFLAQCWDGRPEFEMFNEPIQCDTTTLQPSELLIQDILIPAEMVECHGPPVTGVFGGALHEMRREYREVDRINVHSQAAFAGMGVESLQSPGAPRYVDVLMRVCEKLGWDPNSFHAYRCQIEYPVLHALVNVTFPLKNAGE